MLFISPSGFKRTLFSVWWHQKASEEVVYKTYLIYFFAHVFYWHGANMSSSNHIYNVWTFQGYSFWFIVIVLFILLINTDSVFQIIITKILLQLIIRLVIFNGFIKSISNIYIASLLMCFLWNLHNLYDMCDWETQRCKNTNIDNWIMQWLYVLNVPFHMYKTATDDALKRNMSRVYSFILR